MKRWIITILVCLLVFAGLAGFKFLEISAAIEAGKAYPEPSETVYAIEAGELAYQPEIRLMGELIAPHRLDLRNERPGKIIELNFVSGAEVKAGQVLARLDASTEIAQLDSAKSDEALAEKTWARMKTLKKLNKVSIERFDQARAKLDASRALIAQLESVINKLNLVAPFNGTAGIQSLEVGQYLAANTLLTTLIGNDDYLWVDFNLPQGQMPLAINDEVQIGNVASGKQSTLMASVVAEDSVVSGNARSLKYRAKLENPASYMRPRGRVLVTVAVGEQAMLAAISDESVTRDQFGDYVFILNPDGENTYRAQRQKVTLTPKLDRQYGVVSGLELGTLIASRGAFKLRDGLKVHIQSGTPDDGESMSAARDAGSK